MHVEYTRRNPRHLGGNPWNDPLEKRRIVHYCWRNEMMSYSLKLSEINYQKKIKRITILDTECRKLRKDYLLILTNIKLPWNDYHFKLQ